MNHSKATNRKTLLEFELRKHQFLSQNTRVSIPVCDSGFCLLALIVFMFRVCTMQYQGRSFAFLVVETRPAAVVSITDTDLETEVLEPMEVQKGVECASVVFA